MRDGYAKMAVVALLCIVLPAGPAQTQQDPGRRRAVEAVEQFVAACKARDLERIMKAVELPYHYGGDKAIRKREKLRAMMKVEVGAAVGTAPVKHKVARVQRYKDFRPSITDKEQLKLLDEALGKDGWVVALRVWERDQTAPLSPDGAYPLTLLVRIQAGRAKVVGVYVYRGATA